MKFLRKKIIKGNQYYYFQFTYRINGKSKHVSKYLGANFSHVVRGLYDKLPLFFEEIAKDTFNNLPKNAKNAFVQKSLLPVEDARFWYQMIHHELYESDFNLFRALYAVLFTLNSNRSEGSKVTRNDLESFILKKKTPKTPLEIEVANSFDALEFAFSDKMKWNQKSIKHIHHLLFHNMYPQIAGRFKVENNVINNESTTDWKLVKQELQKLLNWFKENKKKAYPPLLALEFHSRFEAIHPFADGNGRVGRLLFNAFLLQSGYMPVIFFTENHKKYCKAISESRDGRSKKLFHYYIEQVKKTKKSILKYKEEEVLKGGDKRIGKWEIEKGKIKRS